MIDGFLLKKILSLFVHLIPGSLLLLLMLLIGRHWLPRLCNTLAILLCLGLIAGSTPPVSNYFVSSLEQQQPVLQSAPEDTVIILVLGAGHRYADDRPANSVLSATALSRLMEGVRLWQTNKKAFLAVSGAKFGGQLSQAEATQNMAIQLGVPEDRILVFDQARDTEEEIATAAVALLNTNLTQSDLLTTKEKRLVVVSSALHLPRARLIIDDYKLTHSVAPTDFRAIDGKWYLAGSNYLTNLDQAIHEWVGKLWYTISSSLVTPGKVPSATNSHAVE